MKKTEKLLLFYPNEDNWTQPLMRIVRQIKNVNAEELKIAESLACEDTLDGIKVQVENDIVNQYSVADISSGEGICPNIAIKAFAYYPDDADDDFINEIDMVIDNHLLEYMYILHNDMAYCTRQFEALLDGEV